MAFSKHEPRVGRTWSRLLPTAVTALLAAGAIAAPAASAASSCKKATNIEAIVDDSGSMSVTDSNRLRVQGLDLLIDTLGKSTQLGAVEFGSGLEFIGIPPADTVFPPQPVGPNSAAMQTALQEKINADNGATDYNGAFAQSDLDNPSADARIFLTDGGHDVGTYNEGHLTHAVPTYVIGIGIVSGEDQQRLKKIAADTGGKYFPLQDSSQLQSVMNSVGAALTCQTPPKLFIDQLKKGQSVAHQVSIGGTTKSIQITLTWASPLDKFKLSQLKLIAHHQTVAVAARQAPKPRKLKVSETTSATFTVLHVTGLSKGSLSFRVRAAKLGSGSSKATLTTQVGQLRSHK